MSQVFDAASLESRYAFIDDCPPAFLERIVTLPGATIEDRVEGLLRWRDALVAGTLPASGKWPAEVIAAPVRDALSRLDLPRFCRNQPELVDQLLDSVLDAFAKRTAKLEAEVAARLKELEELERERAESEKKPRRKPSTREELRERARREREAQEQEPDSSIEAAWGEQVRAWCEIEGVFGDLGELLGRGWDLTQGILKKTGWQSLVRLRALVERLPQLREIIRALGRFQDSTREESIAEKIFVPIQRLEEERREIRTPLAPTETRGIQRSGDIARMLPGEAVLFGHPKLRLLWHARRAERTLLTYRLEGIDIETVLVEREGVEEREGRKPRPERGPILAIVDTSGSMHGLPEQIAKAVVLEALRTAHAERRRCFVYTYSGPGQVRELELDLSNDGIERLLDFLSYSFGGGNDEIGVLRRVLARMQEQAWKRADVLFVSDGEWPAPSPVVDEVKKVRESGTRFHGVQIGNRGHTGLHAVCEPVHEFGDWAALAGWHR